MSVQSVTEEVFAGLKRARDLFGRVPQPARFAHTADPEATQATVAIGLGAEVEAWHGESSQVYRDTRRELVAGLGRNVAADNAASAGMTVAGATAVTRVRGGRLLRTGRPGGRRGSAFPVSSARFCRAAGVIAASR
jgi:hypothetical protein